MKKVIRSIIALCIALAVMCGLSLSVSAGSSIATAKQISFGDTNYGQMTESHGKDMYEFELSSSGCVTLDVTAYIYRTSYYLYDENGNEVWSSTYQYWNDNTEEYKNNWKFHLLKGTYYLAVCREYSDTGNYRFKISFKTASESFTETQSNTNNSIREADTISLGKTYKGQIALNDDKDLYKFTMSSSGCVTLDVTAYIYRTSYYLYDENGNEVWSSTYQYWNDNTEEYKNNWKIHLLKGTYYLAVCREYSNTGNYQFKTSFKTSSESFTETLDNTNNSIREADTISLGKTYKGQIALNDDKDLYKFKMSSSGCVTLDVTAYIYRTSYYLYDENGNEVWSSTYQYWNDKNKAYDAEHEWTLGKGTYYLAVCNECSDTGNYTFSIKCNHKYKTTKVTKATLSAKGKVYKKCSTCGKTTSSVIAKPTSFKLSTSSYTYNGKYKKPTVTVKDSAGKKISSKYYTVSYKNNTKVGKATVTIKMKGNYSGTKTLTFKINPAKTTVSKLTAGKKNITVAITKKSTQVTGYQLQYSTSKTFSKATTKTISSYKTTKYTLKSLSAKKTYYVRVRTYKTVGKTKYYSGWSTYKYVKTK